MTQEELDALMGGEVDLEELDEIVEEEILEEIDENTESNITEIQDAFDNGISEGNLPFPATNENKMVHQLDDVTKESEAKATEIFDIIENISSELMEKEENIQATIDTLSANVELFTTLSEKFSDVEAFKTSLTQNKDALHASNETLAMLHTSGDSIMSVMDIMQYQDIHRQKIERVINVMRALSRYMNTLFEGRIDDEKRVSSAVHIAGDTHNDLASTDDIEALLAQFGN